MSDIDPEQLARVTTYFQNKGYEPMERAGQLQPGMVVAKISEGSMDISLMLVTGLGEISYGQGSESVVAVSPWYAAIDLARDGRTISRHRIIKPKVHPSIERGSIVVRRLYEVASGNDAALDLIVEEFMSAHTGAENAPK